MNVVISIGNTDNKLTQKLWSEFVTQVNTVLDKNSKIHFFGGPSSYSPYQNACWWIEVDKNKIYSIRSVLREIKYKFNQDSIAWLSGETEFI